MIVFWIVVGALWFGFIALGALRIAAEARATGETFGEVVVRLFSQSTR